MFSLVSVFQSSLFDCAYEQYQCGFLIDNTFLTVRNEISIYKFRLFVCLLGHVANTHDALNLTFHGPPRLQLGPHLWLWDFTVQGPPQHCPLDMGPHFKRLQPCPQPVLTSGSPDWRPVELIHLRTPPTVTDIWWLLLKWKPFQTCSREDPCPSPYPTSVDIWWLLKHVQSVSAWYTSYWSTFLFTHIFI